MNILLFLIPVSMGALILAAWAFIWAVRRGQFEDLDTPALDILREDEHDRPVRTPSAHAHAPATGATGDPSTPGPGQASPTVPADRPASATASADPTPAATSTDADTGGSTKTGSTPMDAAHPPSRNGHDG